LKRAVFLDRDGVIIRDSGYLDSITKLEWVPGIFHTLQRLKELDIPVVVVTNQSGVARGYFSEDDVQRIHAHMQQVIRSRGGLIAAFYQCPFHPEAVLPTYRHENHPDRKPNPGMIIRAARDWNLDLKRSVMIGDKSSDVEAGRRAGLKSYLFDDYNIYQYFCKRQLFK